MSTGDLRLFAAATVPHGHLDSLAEQTRELRAMWRAARWTPPENQHVTLKFLGWVSPDLLDAIVDRCRSVAGQVEPASLRLDQLGAFPNPRRARVLWVGLEDPMGALSTLAGGLDRSLGELGLPTEKRPYSAHLTLARFKVPQRLDALPQIQVRAPFPLDRFGVWRSHLSPRGARYELLTELELGTRDAS